ncbi:O-Antigen ligase [Stieleria neptunia]|uniref:O-Antigen ligase n=1 Tax=Stieleria neptunia TaxID=2527979 RepID=A0A518HQU8_9BACT|nr:O-antigen ligase family protein [Stieleria neptunia]QDV43233.1 O-Antigen ligase [Stieleria neptunia]
MIALIFVFSLLAAVCAVSITKPHVGIIGFYGFVLLDPTWNWRWALPEGFQYQKFIFASIIIGFFLSGFRTQQLSNLSKHGILAGTLFYLACRLSAASSIAPEATEFFMGVIWKELLVLLLAILVLDSPGKLKALLVVVVLAQGYNALQINLEYFQTAFSRYAYRPWGSSGADNNGYSIITTPVLLISISLGLFERRIWTRCLFLGIGLLQAHQIMLMQSRGCMLASVLAIAICIFYMPRRNGNVKWAAVAVFLGAMLAGPSVVEEFSSSFAEGDQRDSSADSRLHLWRAGWKITMDHPVSGVGPNAARVLVPLPQYYEGGLNQPSKALHNLFFDVSTGVGLPGFFCYFFLFCGPLWYSYKTYEKRNAEDDLGPVRLATFTGIIAYLVASMFSSGILFESCYILIASGYCVTNIDLTSAKSHGNPL